MVLAGNHLKFVDMTVMRIVNLRMTEFNILYGLKSKLNVKGSSIATGHPFAATGGRILGVLAKLLHEKGSGRGLVSVCAAGGMGITAILER